MESRKRSVRERTRTSRLLCLSPRARQCSGARALGTLQTLNPQTRPPPPPLPPTRAPAQAGARARCRYSFPRLPASWQFSGTASARAERVRCGTRGTRARCRRRTARWSPTSCWSRVHPTRASSCASRASRAAPLSYG